MSFLAKNIVNCKNCSQSVFVHFNSLKNTTKEYFLCRDMYRFSLCIAICKFPFRDILFCGISLHRKRLN